MTRWAAAILISLLVLTACGRYGPPQRPERRAAPAASQPAEAEPDSESDEDEER